MTTERRANAAPPWQALTAHAYRLDEVVSSLQKAVRRGDTDRLMGALSAGKSRRSPCPTNRTK